MALTQTYVNPAIAGNSGTGSVGDPYGDLQYALNTMTRDAVNGDQINIKAGTDELLAATISLVAYGAPDNGSPLVFRGYTAVANDGGIGDISGQGACTILVGNPSYTHFIDMHLHNCGANRIVQIGNYSSIIHCEIDQHTGYNQAVAMGAYGVVAHCYCHDVVQVHSSGLVVSNYIVGADHDTWVRLNIGGSGTAVNNVVHCLLAGDTGINNSTHQASVIGNSVYNAAAGTAEGIYANGLNTPVILNNIVEGWSGVGGSGIETTTFDVALLAGNAFYNNTAHMSVARSLYSDNNDVLGASPFVSPATGDFRINGTQAGVTEDAFPAAFLGAALTTNLADKGASQAGAGAGGGGAVSISPVRGNVGG